MNIKLGVNPEDNVLLRKIMNDEDVQKAVIDIAKLVCECGKERDVISFTGDMVFIDTSKDEDSLNYMHNTVYDFSYNIVYTISNPHKKGVLLRHVFKNVELPTMIMTVDRLWHSSKDVRASFKVAIIDEFRELDTIDFGVYFDREVLK